MITAGWTLLGGNAIVQQMQYDLWHGEQNHGNACGSGDWPPRSPAVSARRPSHDPASRIATSSVYSLY